MVAQYNNNSYLIAAFNIRAFSTTKLEETNEANPYIIKILRRYDVCLIQEVREPDSKTLDDGSSPLLNKLLSQLSTNSRPYGGVVSTNIGRGKHKERYIYVFRSDIFDVLDTHLFNDVHFGDKFEREPYSVKLALKSNPKFQLALIGVHIKPTDAVQEIGELHQVYNDVEIRWTPKPTVTKPNYNRGASKPGFLRRLLNIFCPCLCSLPSSDDGNNAELGLSQPLDTFNQPTLVGPIILGDLNAGKNYFGKKAKANLELIKDAKFNWLITDDVDTTVASTTDFAYDRIIVPTKQSHLFTNPQPFKFDDAYKLDSKLALNVSDHYPVEVLVTLA